jgi:predicted Zn-dependent protease with MMP-like domain
MKLKRREFEQLVAEALDDLPPFFARAMQNVAVQILPRPLPHHYQEVGLEQHDLLLGLYEGIPLTERTSGYQMVPPDSITLFQAPIEAVTDGSAEAIRAEVRHTVIHEIAHHFGISDERLHELGAY